MNYYNYFFHRSHAIDDYFRPSDLFTLLIDEILASEIASLDSVRDLRNAYEDYMNQ